MKVPCKVPFALVLAIMAGVLSWLILKWAMPVTFLFSGDIFTQEFHYVYSEGYAGDSFQVGVNKMFVASAILVAVVLPVISGLLAGSNLKTKTKRWLFMSFSIALCLFPVSALGVATIALIRYTLDMGLTTARTEGVACGLVGICVIALFLIWIARAARSKQQI